MSETGKTLEKVRNTLQPLVAKSWTEGVALATSVPENVAKSWTEGVALANSVPENVAKSVTESVANSVPENFAKSLTETVANSVPGNVAKSVTGGVAKSLPDSSAVRKPKELLEVRQITSPGVCETLKHRRISTVTHTNTSVCPAQLAFVFSE